MNIKKLILNNFGLKLTALFLALALWIIISGKEYSYQERTFESSVEFYNAADNIDVSSRPEKVRLRVKGTSREFEKISPEDFKLKIDLQGITQDTSLNYFSEDALEIPPGIRPDEVTVHPRMISVTVKQIISKDVTVKVNFSGKFKPGIKLLEWQVVPKRVKISGYKSQIEAIDTVYTAGEIVRDEIKESRTIKLPLQKTQEIVKFVGAEEVEVRLVVENQNKSKKSDEQGKK